MKVRSNKLRLGAVIAMLFGLSACSGGAGSTDTVQPPTNTVNPPVSGTKVTVNGVISDTARFNPQLVMTVGDQEYTQPVFTGNNEFSFEIDAAAADAPVRLEAFDDATSLLLLASLGPFSSLDLNDNVTLRINEFTTAAYALAKAQMPDNQSVTAQDIDMILSDVSADELTSLAAVQFYLMSDDTNAAVPPTYTDSVQLLVDIARLQSTFLADIEILHPGVFDEAKEAVLSSETAYLDFSSKAGVYFSEDTQVLYALYENSTGRADFFDDDIAKTLGNWGVGDDGELTIEYVAENGRVDELRLLNATPTTLQTIRTRTFATSVADEAAAATFNYFSFAPGFDVANVPGTYALGSSIQLELLAGGGGSLMNTLPNIVEQVIWRVDGEGNIVASAGGAGSVTHIIAPLSDGAVADAVLYSQVISGGAVEAMSVEAFIKQ